MKSKNTYFYCNRSILFSLNATIALLQTRKTSKNHMFEEFKKKILLPLNEDKVELSSRFF